MNHAIRSQARAWSVTICLLPALLMLSPTATAQEQETPYRVLFLNLGPALLPWTLEMFSACRDEFAKLTERHIEFYLENVSPADIEISARRETLRTFLRERYEGQLDFIVARDDFPGLSEIRDAFPDIPIILPTQHLGQGQDAMSTLPAVYRVITRLSPERTARLVLEICPETRKLVMISDPSSFGRLFEERARQDLGESFKGVEIEYWSGIPLSEMKTQVASLRKDHALLFLYMARDRENMSYIPRDVAKALSAVSSVPVFGIADSYLGNGVVGGYVESAKMVGRRAAGMLARLAEGRELEQFIRLEEYGEYQFDWQQMQRWHIPESRIPMQARILHRPDNFFERHAWIVPALEIGVVLLGVLVLGLFWALRLRRHTGKVLRESEERYRALAEHSGALICELDSKGRYLYVNPEHEKILGYTPQTLLHNEINFGHPDEAEASLQAFTQLLNDRAPSDHVWRFQRRDGEWRWFRCLGSTYTVGDDELRVVVVAYDITEQTQAEDALKLHSTQLEIMVHERTKELHDAQEQLIRKEKLANLGELAGSVAHELRHPLGVLSNASYFLSMTLSDADAGTKEYLAMIADEVRKSDKIISDLLAFSRQQSSETPEKSETQIAELISDVLKEHPPPDGIKISLDILPELPLLFVDRQQIEQVLTNLLLNAYQAMPEGGSVAVGARQWADGNGQEAGGRWREAGGRRQWAVESPSDGEPSLPPVDRGLPPADCLLLTVKDTGIGIAPEHLDKLFEPLFSTKPKGIGLGLAISKHLIEANGGRIEVMSRLGNGTTFTLFLPLVDQEGDPHAG